MNRLPLLLLALLPLAVACGKETPRDVPVVAASAPPPAPTFADAAPAPAPPTTPAATTTSATTTADAGAPAPATAEACDAKCTAEKRCTTLVACHDCIAMCMLQGGPPLQGTLTREPVRPAGVSSAKKPGPTK